MRAQDIIRAVLDILDHSEEEHEHDECGCGGTCDSCNSSQDDSRFKQIFAMLDNPSQGPLANSPNEVISDVDSVTTLAGGGLNGPKHPHDIRVKDPGAYQ